MKMKSKKREILLVHLGFRFFLICKISSFHAILKIWMIRWNRWGYDEFFEFHNYDVVTNV